MLYFMSSLGGEVQYDGAFFRVEHVPIEGREAPYEFVHRIGAVTILPILGDTVSEASVLMIRNQRTHYGTFHELPGGNIDGGHDTPENPFRTGHRELAEETGYVPADRSELELFLMRDVSRSILYPRYFGVARGVTYVGSEAASPSEVITAEPVALEEYLSSLLKLERGEAFPEVTLAFAKAAMAYGQDVLAKWLVTGSVPEDVATSFSPWLYPVSDKA